MLGDAIDKLNALSIRKDPYAHLKDALERGETIQFRFNPMADWRDHITKYNRFSYPVECYRIKPKTRTLYKWMISYDDKEFMETSYFFETLLDVENNCDNPKYIKRLDYTAIEVEV